MTRRERMEARLERRRQWAESRRSKAAVVAREAERYRGDHAFNFQPGHIPERARLIRREERAFGDLQMAGHHESKADGIERQLERSIFSDDENALEALAAKAKALDEQAERAVAINKAWRKGKGQPGWGAGLMSEALEHTLTERANEYSWTKRRGPMDPSYARANARRARQRIEEVRARQQRAAEAEAAGGTQATIREDVDWAVVTFSEKPRRKVLEALRAAGFRWGGGSWHGPASRLPKGVLE